MSRRIRAGSLCLALALVLPLAPSRAESPGEAALQERIAKMEAELAALKELAIELQAEKARLAEERAALAEERELQAEQDRVLTQEVRRLREDIELPREEPELESRFGMGPAASKVYAVDKGLSFGGYGQGWYTGHLTDKGTNTDRFDLTRWILYTGYKFSDKIVLNTELEWEHASSGSGGSVSVEFAQLDFLFSEAFNLRTGLLLVPMGFINEIHEPLYYHGNQRPEVERQIIPTTWRENGFGFHGRVADSLSYRFYLVNSLRGANFSSSGIRGGRQKGANARSEHMSWVLRLDWEPKPEWTIGASILSGKQGQAEPLALGGGRSQSVDADMTLVEAHAQWRKNGWQARVLGAWTRLGDAGLLSQAQFQKGNGPVAERMNGAYAEVSYDLLRKFDPGSTRALDLFFRYERFDTQDRVPLGFAADPSKDQVVRTWGLGFKPHPEVILKLDYRNFSRGADELNLGFGWVF